MYARVLLLDAYLYNGHFEEAINLCQELSNSKHQTTQILAQYYLAEIFPETKLTAQKSLLNSTKSSLIPAQATELINTGYEAITKKRYPEAIQSLVLFFQSASPDTKEYLKAHKLLIKAYQGNGQSNHAIAKLEDPEFAKLFTVYGDDQIEARYVLSTSLMDKIVNFRKRTNRNIYISFVEDMIYIAIEEAVENNIFDPNLYKSVLRFAPLREYFETLNLMLGIVEDLNLDRRI